MKRLLVVLITLLVGFALFNCEYSAENSDSAAIVNDHSITANGYTLTGKLIYHSYTDYAFDGVKSWMLNFDTNSLRNITVTRLRGAMNYHFNHNGTEVVFMSDDGNVSGDEWDIWVASVTSTGLSNATKITSTNGTRDEDPKFSSDGTKIIFKQNLYYIKTINRSAFSVNGTNQTPTQTTVLSGGSTEVGMPYFITGSTTNFLYSAGDGNNSSIWKRVSGVSTQLYNAAGYQEYYPWCVDSNTFYFSKGISGSSPDQIYIGNMSGTGPTGSAFNTSGYEVADPCMINYNWVSYSSNRSGGSGDYDIWLGNVYTGETYNLNSWKSGANHSNRDLGSTFYGTIN